MTIKEKFGNVKERFGEMGHKKAIAAFLVVGLISALFIGWTVVGVFYGEEILEEEDETFELSIGGSTTCFPMILECARLYMKDNEDVDIGVSGVGSGPGVAGVLNNIYKLGMASSSPTKYDPEHRTSYRAFAHDAVIMVMSEGNFHFKEEGGEKLLPRLTMRQIRHIFNGSWTDWSQVATDNDDFVGSGAIEVIGRDSSSGTRETFESLTSIKGKYQSTGAVYDQELNSNGAVQAAVKSNPYAIGYVGIAYLTGLDYCYVAKEGSEREAAVEPIIANIRSHSYPLSRYLYLVWKGEVEDDTQDFIDFVFSVDGQTGIEAAGGVAL